MKSFILSVAISVLILIETVFGAPRIKTIEDETTTAAAVVGKGNKVESMDDAYKFLAKFGYIDTTTGTTTKDVSNINDVSAAIKKLQKFAGLPVTGKLDEATLKLMNSPRCHLPDSSTPQMNGKFKRFATRGKWQKNGLSYSIQNYPSSPIMQDKNKVSEALQTAFDDWSSVANVNFQKTGNNDADVRIGFYKRDHGDGYPFDGPGQVLAHGFFPEAGMLHFDDEEQWNTINNGPNLRQVATHEIGHVLGLDHSNVNGATMFPYYTYSSNFQLASDDIAGIVSLYGGRKQPLATSTPTILKTTTTFKVPVVPTILKIITTTKVPVVTQPTLWDWFKRFFELKAGV